MLTAPNDQKRPLFSTEDIKAFYLKHGPKIFPFHRGLLAKAMNIIKAITGPKHDGKYLHEIVRKTLRKTRLLQTLTNVVIPAFDIKKLQPTVFSTFKAKSDPSFDALLSDVCIGTSAAPTYLPAHYFITEKCGVIREFNLIDGGVAANNPALLAISEVTREVLQENRDFFPIKPLDYGRFLVISIGTGLNKSEEEYSAEEARKWGVLGWLSSGGSSPLLNTFLQASGDMVDIHISAVFQALRSENNYLRIQDDTLRGRVSSVDLTTKENLEELVSIGELLLKSPVSRVNLDTGKNEPLKDGVTNGEALTRFAEILSKERKLREARSPRRKLTSSK